MYVIIAIAVFWYTVLIIVGLVMAVREAKKETNIIKCMLSSVIKELKYTLIKEETKSMTNLDKGVNKSNRSSEPINFKPEPFVEKKGLTLTDIITRKPTPQEYDEIEGLLTRLVKKTFSDYKFLVARSSDETQKENFLQIVSHYSEAPALHREIFRRSVEYGIDMRTLQERFASRVAAGQVLDLGDNVVVITDDNTGNLPTGVSPVNSGLEDAEIMFIISFVKKENFDAWHKHNFPKKDQYGE